MNFDDWFGKEYPLYADASTKEALRKAWNAARSTPASETGERINPSKDTESPPSVEEYEYDFRGEVPILRTPAEIAEGHRLIPVAILNALARGNQDGMAWVRVVLGIPADTRPGNVPGASLLAEAKTLAEYWLRSGRESESSGEAFICAENSANVWKNSAYALAAKLASTPNSAIGAGSDDLWAMVRLAAEGSDWKRDGGESLVEWALRTLTRAGSKTPKQVKAEHHEMLRWEKSGIWNRDLLVHDVLDELEAMRRGVAITYQTPGDDPLRKLRRELASREKMLARIAQIDAELPNSTDSRGDHGS